jgi:hypothetical protein
MALRLLLIPAILGMTTTVADAQRSTLADQADAHSQAAALLSRPQQHRASNAQQQARHRPDRSAATDAQARAAALLSGQRPRDQVKTTVAVTPRSAARVLGDAHAQAAALLSGSRPLRKFATHDERRADEEARSKGDGG